MKNLITKKDILENETFFWVSYFSFFRGFDPEKELNIDDILTELIEINIDKLFKWQEIFFEPSRYISGKLSEELSFQIEIEKDEINYFISDEYIGSISGHFEAWSLTLEEICYFEKFEFVFLLLLPMVGITKKEFEFTKDLINQKLKYISKFEDHSEYISECITNGLVMNGEFYKDEEVGIVNNQNHSVRNIKKYPDYKERVINLNKILTNITN